MTQSRDNQIIIAAAGGRKTTSIVLDALRHTDQNILITTYTQENVDQIKEYLIENNGCIPSNITVLTWYSFLLRDGIKPYQNFKFNNRRVRSIDFDSRPSQYVAKTDHAYFLNRANNLYRDRVSDCAVLCNELSGGLPIRRLEMIFNRIYIDELQDLSGWDFNWVNLLLDSSIVVTMVGDPRQATYSTTNSQKNRRKKGKNVLNWVDELVKQNKCLRQDVTESYRCNQDICDFADGLYPEFPKTISKNCEVTGHDGIYFVNPNDLLAYTSTHKPVVLRWDKRMDTLGMPALNIGLSKGRTYDRVLIFPTEPMRKYLDTGNIAHAGDRAKFYVAVTRARYSAAFVVER